MVHEGYTRIYIYIVSIYLNSTIYSWEFFFSFVSFCLLFIVAIIIHTYLSGGSKASAAVVQSNIEAVASCGSGPLY